MKLIYIYFLRENDEYIECKNYPQNSDNVRIDHIEDSPAPTQCILLPCLSILITESQPGLFLSIDNIFTNTDESPSPKNTRVIFLSLI